MSAYDNCIVTDLNQSNNPNQFVIEDALDDDNSIARLSSRTMDKLELFCGDAVKLKGKRPRRETICVVLSDDSCSDDHIRVNNVTQNNLRVHSGDIISIEECQHVQYGKHIYVVPIDDTVKDIKENLLQEYLQPYFHDCYRPIRVDNTFIVRTKMRFVEFKVIETEPSPYCIVAPDTIIHCDGEPIQRQMEEIYFDDIDGLEEVKQQLKELIDYPIKYPEKYLKFGMKPSNGVLLYGPPDCGKTMLAKAVANECDINFISMKYSELLSMSLNNIEDNVRNIFDKACQIAPCVLFIDELDCMSNSRGTNVVVYENHSIDRFINQILTEIDGISIQTKIFIIAATEFPNKIDRTILQSGRIDQTIYVPLPDEKTRENIFKITLQKYSLAKDVDLVYLAKISIGFCSGDIVQFCRKACEIAIKDSKKKQQKIQCSNSIHEIRWNHFEEANKIFSHASLPDYNLHIYEKFSQMWQLPSCYNSSFNTFNYLQNNNDHSNIQTKCENYTDDDDLYA